MSSSYITPAYAQLIEDALNSLGLEIKEAAKKAGISRTTFWRVRTGQGGVSLKKALEARAFLLKHRPELNIPPPIVRVSDRDQYDWIELGEQLRAVDPTEFARLMAALRKKLEGIAIVRAAEDELNLSVNPDDDED